MAARAAASVSVPRPLAALSVVAHPARIVALRARLAAARARSGLASLARTGSRVRVVSDLGVPRPLQAGSRATDWARWLSLEADGTVSWTEPDGSRASPLPGVPACIAAQLRTPVTTRDNCQAVARARHVHRTRRAVRRLRAAVDNELRLLPRYH